MSLTFQYIPYSVSKIKAYESCPYKFKLNYIDKVKVSTRSDALIKGSVLHDMIEKYLKNETVPFPFDNGLSDEKNLEICTIFSRLIPYLKSVKKIVKSRVGVERKFGLKISEKQITISEYNDKEDLIRGAIDYFYIQNNKTIIIDWKSGKVPLELDTFQLEVYALWAFESFDFIEEVEVKFYYIEHLEEKTRIFTRKDRKALYKSLFSKIKAIEKAIEFPKNETPLCNYCSYRTEGVCKPETQEEFLQKINKYNFTLSDD